MAYPPEDLGALASPAVCRHHRSAGTRRTAAPGWRTARGARQASGTAHPVAHPSQQLFETREGRVAEQPGRRRHPGRRRQAENQHRLPAPGRSADTNPVVEEIFLNQRSHAHLVMVGDSAQAIYQWRGARDVMTTFHATQLNLSKSFRFGPHLAAEANRCLAIADAPLRLQRTDAICTEAGPADRPDAILCRTNVGAMNEVMHQLAAGHRVALVGGGTRCVHWPARPTTSKKAAVPPTPSWFCSPPGVTCRTTPNTTRPTVIFSH